MGLHLPGVLYRYTINGTAHRDNLHGQLTGENESVVEVVTLGAPLATGGDKPLIACRAPLVVRE